MRTKLSILLFLLSSFVFGQKNDLLNSKFSIQTSPLNLLDPWNGSLVALGTEFKIYKHITSYSEYGLYFQKVNLVSDLIRNKGFMIKEDIKYYRDKKEEGINEYISLELSYSEQSYHRRDSIDFSKTTTSPANGYYKNYSVTRSFPGISIQYGALMVKKKRLLIDIYGGIGIRINNIQCDLTDEEAKNRELGDWNNPKNWIQKNGNHAIPKLSFGVRIGYRII